MAAMRSRHETGKTETEIEEEFEQKKQDLQANLQDQLSNTVKTFIETSTQDVVETVEKKIKEREKTGIEDSVRDHLRGFSRTIPSFLMAYGNDTVTLATFDVVIPNPEFLEVTSITLDQFRFLRDGGKYKDAETGEEKEFAGNLFDPVVFDDSVKEFLRLKKKLADYFDEKSIEDIFDYISVNTKQNFTAFNFCSVCVTVSSHTKYIYSHELTSHLFYTKITKNSRYQSKTKGRTEFCRP